MSRAQAALIALCFSVACTSAASFELPEHASYVIVELRANDEVLRARAATRGDVWPLGLVPGEGERVRVLGYDEPLEDLRLFAGPLKLSATGALLPAPDSAREWSAERVRAIEGEELQSFRARLRVEVDVCDLAPALTAVSGVPREQSIRAAFPLGDDVILITPQSLAGDGVDLPPAVWRIANGSTIAERIEAFAYPVDAPVRPPPIGFLDDATPMILFPRTSTDSRIQYDLRSITSTGGAGPRLVTTMSRELGTFQIHELASARIRGERVIIGLGSGFEALEPFNAFRSTLVRLDEPSGRWLPLEPRDTQINECFVNLHFQILDLDAAGMVTLARDFGAIRRFALAEGPGAASSPLIEVPPVCLSSRLRLRSGLELLNITGAPSGLVGSRQRSLAWRWGEGPWRVDANNSLESHAMLEIDGGFLASGNENMILFFKAAFLDAAPVQCTSTGSFGIKAYAMARLASGRVFVGGAGTQSSGSPGVFLEFE